MGEGGAHLTKFWDVKADFPEVLTGREFWRMCWRDPGQRGMRYHQQKERDGLVPGDALVCARDYAGNINIKS